MGLRLRRRREESALLREEPELRLRGSKFPIFEVSGSKDHTIHGRWDQIPQCWVLGLWGMCRTIIQGDGVAILEQPGSCRCKQVTVRSDSALLSWVPGCEELMPYPSFKTPGCMAMKGYKLEVTSPKEALPPHTAAHKSLNAGLVSTPGARIWNKKALLETGSIGANQETGFIFCDISRAASPTPRKR